MLSNQVVCISLEGNRYIPIVDHASPHPPRLKKEHTHRHLRIRERSSISILKSSSLSSKAFNDHIPAVKIAGDVISPLVLLDNIESVCDDLLQVVPDSCISSSLMDRTMNKTAATSSADPIVPVSVTSSTTTDTSIPGVTDESDEDSDLDEFLLDAALWL